MTYGERVQKYRKMRDMTQEDVAAATGIVATSISKIEHGKREVTLEEAVKLSEVLGVSLSELAGIPEPAHVRSEVSRSMQKLREGMFELERSFASAQ